ncbi:MAG: hypothetical protein KDE55_04765 [Novosphingobium sp.]|nr:hypothetical protein [Novosphingobium sp.]
MGWGDAFANAWDAATDTAKAAAQAVADTAKAAVDYAAKAADMVLDVAGAVVKTVVKGVTSIVGQAIEMASNAFGTLWNTFGKIAAGAGRLLKKCPLAEAAQAISDAAAAAADAIEDWLDDDINIVSIDWLDGTDEKIIGDCEQYVNLPRDAKWLADSDIANIDRLSINPRFLVKFDKPKSAGFQWRLVPIAGGWTAYTGTEEGRNGNYVAGPKDWTSGSVSEGKVVMEGQCKLVAGGGYKFQLEAKDDKGKVVKSGVITTKRLFWYVELPMTGLTSVLSSTATVDSEYAKHHMVLKQLPDLQVPYQQNIGSNTDTSTLSTNVNAAIAGSAKASTKAPYLLRIAYTDHLAVKNSNRPQRVDGVAVGPAAAAVQIPVTSSGLRSGDNAVTSRPLWNNIVTGEGWFVSAQYTPDGGGAAVNIPAAKVTTVGAGPSFTTISVDVTGLAAGTGTIIVNVNVVDRMRGGLAFGGSADICICTRAWWRTSADDKQVCTVIHEMGHQVHQVSAGSGTDPDRVSTQYTNRGHVGSHCHNGCTAGQANYNTSANVSSSTCPMFGTVNRKTAFCGNCAPAVKKVDIGAGF